MGYKELLENTYNDAVRAVADNSFSADLSIDMTNQVKLIVNSAEHNRGIIAVLTTLLSHKILFPGQDIRCHQQQLEGGFSGRTIDTNYITPFLKAVDFPSMSTSGWLTRSLEQAHPYTLDYPGKIKPQQVKDAFLHIINDVQENNINAQSVLSYFFSMLIMQREGLKVDLAKPHSLSIAKIVKILERHFTFKYKCHGASRLPTVALYAAYECMMTQVSRYNGKILCPLQSHNSADSQSGRIGDIDINNADGSAFEGVEVKHEIAITTQLIKDSYEKFKIYKTDRYYLLTTANMDAADWEAIEQEIDKIRRVHGCQVIVNGVYSTLKYYLRLINDPSEFIDHYVDLLKEDKAVKYQHKVKWNDIISEG